MGKPRYTEAEDGEWIYPRRRGFRMCCCDCGLVHVVNFRLVGGQIEFQTTRDERATAQVRRWKRAPQRLRSRRGRR